MNVIIINTDKSAEGKSATNLQASLEKLLGRPIQVLTYGDERVRAIIDEVSPCVLVFSGQSTPWWLYSEDELAGVYDLIRGSNHPMLGICGGHQLIAKAFGARVGPIRAMCEEPSQNSYDGYWREEGMVEIQLIAEDAIFDGLPRRVTMPENHCEEVKDLPPGFILLATGRDCRIQMMRHSERKIYGTQFHPERANDDYRDGRRLLSNFFALFGVPTVG